MDKWYENVGDAPIQAHVDGNEKLKQVDIVDDSEGVVVQPAKPMSQPWIPSAAEVAAHNITHLPYRSWCPHCVSARRPNTQHRSSSSSSRRTDPLIVADYWFIKDNDDDDMDEDERKALALSMGLIRPDEERRKRERDMMFQLMMGNTIS